MMPPSSTLNLATLMAKVTFLFWSVLEHGLHLIHRSLHDIHGYFHVENNIPIGVGMGASAALCVAMARWFQAQHWIARKLI